MLFLSEQGATSREPLRTFFLDPGLLLTTRVKDWIAQLRQRHLGFNRYGDDSALSLFLSGAPKTGKSLLLTKVIPALLREDELFGIGGDAEVRVWHVDTTGFDKQRGAAGFLCSLLDRLLDLAAQDGMTEAALYAKGLKSYSHVASDLEGFIRRLPRARPTFILLDEVQNFFLLERAVSDASGVSRRVLDESELVTMRAAFKKLVGSSPLHCIWVITGSKMAYFWANLALCPVNGYSMLTHIPAVHLPTTVPDTVKLQAWDVLRSESSLSTLPQQLLDMSPPHHAALVFFCTEWLRMGRPADAADLCIRTFKSKIFPEILEDYRAVLETFPVDLRKMLVELLSDQGVCKDHIPLGVLVFVEAELVQVPGKSQHVRLESPLVASAIRALLDGDGQLAKGRGDGTASMLSDYQASIYRTFGALLFKCRLGDSSVGLLNQMAASVLPQFWLSDWFQDALRDNLQQPRPLIANSYQHAVAEGELEPWEHMRYFLALWANCARHGDEKRLGLATEFVKRFPAELWVFAQTGVVQHEIRRLQHCAQL